MSESIYRNTVFYRLLQVITRHQTILITLSSIALISFVYSGWLLYRQYDTTDTLKQGQWLLKQGKVSLALQNFRTLVARHPNIYEGYFAMGKAYLELDDPARAAAAFNQFIRLNQGDSRQHIPIQVAMAAFLMTRQDYAKAEAKLLAADAQAKKEHLKYQPLIDSLRELYTDWGDAEMIKETLPAYETAFTDYAKANNYTQNRVQQESVKRKIIDVSEKILSIYQLNQETDKSLALLQKTLQYDPSPENMLAMGEIYESQGKVDDAMAWYKSAYERNPDEAAERLANILMTEGRRLLKAGDAQQASLFREKAVELADAHHIALLNTDLEDKTSDNKSEKGISLNASEN